jgi:hypothetical protein
LTFFDLFIAALVYLVWQVLYFLKTEVIDKAYLDTCPDKLTSLRWLTTDLKNGLARAVLKLCKSLGVYGPREEFNSYDLKTKVVFMSSQFVYTCITFLLSPLFYYSSSAHMVFIFFIFSTSIFYGGSFYIEVFSQRYQVQLQRKRPNTVMKTFTSLDGTNVSKHTADTTAIVKEQSRESRVSVESGKSLGSGSSWEDEDLSKSFETVDDSNSEHDSMNDDIISDFDIDN